MSDDIDDIVYENEELREEVAQLKRTQDILVRIIRDFVGDIDYELRKAGL